MRLDIKFVINSSPFSYQIYHTGLQLILPDTLRNAESWHTLRLPLPAQHSSKKGDGGAELESPLPQQATVLRGVL